MATKKKSVAKTTAKPDPDRERFKARVEALDGLLHVAADLAGAIDDAGLPDDLWQTERELYAIMNALPVFASSLGSYGPSGYFLSRTKDRPLAEHLEDIAALLRSADRKGVDRGN